MSSKTLKLGRVFANSIYNNLRNVPPKDYPTTAEIRSTLDTILPALKVHLTEYIEIVKEAEDISVRVKAKEFTDKRRDDKISALNKRLVDYNKEHGHEVVDIVLDDEGFKTLKSQFDRDNWGKNWVANIEEFGELMAAFEGAAK